MSDVFYKGLTPEERVLADEAYDAVEKATGIKQSANRDYTILEPIAQAIIAKRPPLEIAVVVKPTKAVTASNLADVKLGDAVLKVQYTQYRDEEDENNRRGRNRFPFFHPMMGMWDQGCGCGDYDQVALPKFTCAGFVALNDAEALEEMRNKAIMRAFDNNSRIKVEVKDLIQGKYCSRVPGEIGKLFETLKAHIQDKNEQLFFKSAFTLLVGKDADDDYKDLTALKLFYGLRQNGPSEYMSIPYGRPGEPAYDIRLNTLKAVLDVEKYVRIELVYANQRDVSHIQSQVQEEAEAKKPKKK